MAKKKIKLKKGSKINELSINSPEYRQLYESGTLASIDEEGVPNMYYPEVNVVGDAPLKLRKKRQLAKADYTDEELERYMYQGKRPDRDKDFLLPPGERLKIYNAVLPFEYPDKELPKALKRYITGEERKFLGQESIKEEDRDLGRTDEDAWAHFMGLPQLYNTVDKSEYLPTDSKNKNAEYYTIRKGYPDFDELLLENAHNWFQRKENTNANTLRGVGSPFMPLENVTYSKGQDERGKYYSMYDVYDFNVPYQKGIGKPYEVYDRVYYDDTNPDKPVVLKKSYGGKINNMKKNKLPKYQTGGPIDPNLNNRLMQYLFGRNTNKPSILDVRSPNEYGVSLGDRFNIQSGLSFDPMTGMPTGYGKVGINNKGFNLGLEKRKGQSTFNVGYDSPNFNIDATYSNTNKMPSVGGNVGFNTKGFNVGVGGNYSPDNKNISANVGYNNKGFNAGLNYDYSGQSSLSGNVGYGNDLFNVGLSGNYAPGDANINLNTTYNLGKRKKQKAEPIPLAFNTPEEIQLIKEDAVIDSNEAAGPPKKSYGGKITNMKKKKSNNLPKMFGGTSSLGNQNPILGNMWGTKTLESATGPLAGVMKMLNGPLAPLAGMAMSSVTDMVHAINTPERERRPTLQNASSYTFDNGGLVGKKSKYVKVNGKRMKIDSPEYKEYYQQVMSDREKGIYYNSPIDAEVVVTAKKMTKAEKEEEQRKRDLIQTMFEEYEKREKLTDPYNPDGKPIITEAPAKQPFNHTLGYNILEGVDPTGITSYPDVYEAWTDGELNWSDITEPLGALPGLGKLFKLGKIGKVFKGVPPKSTAENIYNTVDFLGNAIDTSSDIYQDNVVNKANGGIIEPIDPVDKDAAINEMNRNITSILSGKPLKTGLTMTKLNPNEEATYQEWVKSLTPNLQGGADDNYYDMRGAWQVGEQPELFYNDEQGNFQSAHPIDVNQQGSIYEPHLFSRNPITGKSLKSPYHTSFQHALEGDIKSGGTPHMNLKTGDFYTYGTGGTIKIKPSKKGTFTKAAKKHGKSVQAFASQVLANKDNYSPAMVKKANFARNASKWKKAVGGVVRPEEGYTLMPNDEMQFANMPAAFDYANGGLTGTYMDAFDAMAFGGMIDPSMAMQQMMYGSYAQGGQVPQNIPVEVEGEEMYEMPNGQVGEFSGPKHENGGMPMALPEGTKIYSDRLKVNGKTMAARKDKREANIAKLEKLLTKNPNDKFIKEALKRQQETNALQEQGDMQQQEMANEQQAQEEMAMEEMLMGAAQQDMQEGMMMAMGGMIKRADGSYSKRGLWDNIRANKGSGKKPTKEMLKQEKKIRAAQKAYGGMVEYAGGGRIPTMLGNIAGTVTGIHNLNRLTDPIKKAFTTPEPITTPYDVMTNLLTGAMQNPEQLLGNPLVDYNSAMPDYISTKKGVINLKDTPTGFVNPMFTSPSADANVAVEPGSGKGNRFMNFLNNAVDRTGDFFSGLFDKNGKPKKDKNTKNEYDLTEGDKTGMLGTSIGMYGPALMTMLNKMQTPPNQNFYSTFGQEALRTQEEAEGLAGISKDEAYRKNLMRANALRKQLANSARGVGDIRSGQLAAELAEQEGARGILTNYLQGMSQLKGQRAGLQQQIDQTRMGGEYQRDLADRQDVDQYYTNLAENVANASNMMQKQGRDLNVVQYNKDIMNLAKAYSKYGIYAVRDPRSGLLTLAQKGADGKITYLSEDEAEELAKQQSEKQPEVTTTTVEEPKKDK